MPIAIILGIVAGVVSFLPLVWGMNKARMATPTSNIGYAGGLLLGVLGSFIILAAAVIICIVAFREMTLYFAISEAAALVVFAIAYGLWRQLR